MECKIFYSWQSDNKKARNFISDCIKQLNKDLPEIVTTEITRDTQGVPGSPDIGETIFRKIDNCDVFIADATIINASDNIGRLTPNPNVMLELGYAIKSLGWERIILLYNKDESDVTALPFDINHQRMTGFSVSDKRSEYKRIVVANVISTIQLLKDKDILHGGNPSLIQIRKETANVLYKGIEKVLEEYIKYKKQDPSDPEDRIAYSNFLVINDTMINEIDKLNVCLSLEEVCKIKRILLDLRNAGNVESEKGAFYYIEDLIKIATDEFYIYFCDQLPGLELKEVLIPELIDLINKLDATYLSKVKVTDTPEVFYHVKDRIIIKNKKEHLLCDGSYDNGGFTGYIDSEKYCGYCKNSERCGEGYQKCTSFHKAEWELSNKEVEGTWAENKLIDGVIHDTFVIEENNEYEVYKNFSGDIMYPGNMPVDFMEIEDIVDCIDEIKHYYFGDVLVANGTETIIKESLRPFTKYCNDSDISIL